VIGNIQSRIVYDGFGNVESGDDGSSLGGDFRFQGQWLESESGLYYMRARDYDSETGLFLSRDAVDVQEQGVESFNPYQFAFGNPLVYSDPTGLISITEINATLEIDRILFTIEQRAKQEVLSRFKDKAIEAAGEILWNAMSTFIPQNFQQSPLTKAIKGLTAENAGKQFEKDLKQEAGKLFNESGVDSSQIFLEVGVDPKTGYANGNYIQFPKIVGIPKAGERRPDFLVTPSGGKPIENRIQRDAQGRSYVIGDIKLQLKTIVNTYIGTEKHPASNPEQWDAISLYARNNGYRVAAFITLFGANSKNNQKAYFEEIAKKAAIKKGFVIFIVSILPGVGF
jgi:RHS repeat-associated protein